MPAFKGINTESATSNVCVQLRRHADSIMHDTDKEEARNLNLFRTNGGGASKTYFSSFQFFCIIEFKFSFVHL